MLEDKPHHKHLGIILQNNRKWDEHHASVIFLVKQICDSVIAFNILDTN